MGEPAMNKSELTAIGKYVKSHIKEWIRDELPESPGYKRLPVEDRDIFLSERVVRVEEGQKHIGELQQQTLQKLDKQFELSQRSLEERQLHIDKQFELSQKNYEERQIRIDRQFELAQKNFEERQLYIDKQFGLIQSEFEAIQAQMDRRFEQSDKRFEQVDKRFEQVDKRFEQVDKRFEQVDKRFEELRGDMNHRFNQMFAYFTTGFIIIGTLMTVYQFLS